MRQIFLDTETTGLSAANGDRLVEIAGVSYDGRRLVEDDEFHSYINPHRDMPEQSQRIHGLSAEFLADKPDFPAIAERLCDFLRDADVFIHNAEFDQGFLDAELKRAGYSPLSEIAGRVVCTLKLSRRINVGLRRHSLDALCAHFNVDATKREQRHGALIDARLLGQVYVAMSRGQVIMNMPTYAPTEILTDGSDVPVRLATASEQKEHEKMLDVIEKKTGKKPLWKT